MDRLQIAVEAGIITQAQRDAIEGLPLDPRAFQFSFVHVLWFCGAGLIAFALFLLAVEISQAESGRLAWVCLAYTGLLAGLDYVIKGRDGMRVLSSLVLMAMGICATFAVFSFVETFFGLEEPGKQWSTYENWYGPLVQGPYLYGSVLLVVSGILIHFRGFLPAWLAVLGVIVGFGLDVFYGNGLDDNVDQNLLWLAFSIPFLATGWFFDLKAGPNHGFWLNKAALMTFTIYTFAVVLESAFENDPYWSLLPSGIALMLFSIFVRRPAGLSVGAIALGIYVGYWFGAWDNLYVAAALLGLIGLGSIYIGVRAHLIEDQLDRFLPSKLRELRPESRVDPVTFGF
ncbi:MAG: hypothetical protein ABJM43_06205 [Paracoccaceae bacterium]